MERYRDIYTKFKDDVQGTGAVILAGIINTIKRTGVTVKDQRAVLIEAGSAALGVTKQIIEFFINEGLIEDEAKDCFYLVIIKGLVTNDRGDNLAKHKNISRAMITRADILRSYRK